MVGTNADVPEVASTQTAFVGDGTDDGTGSDVMTLTDADAVRRHFLAGLAVVRAGRILVERPRWPRLPRLAGCPRRGRRLGLEQEGFAVARLDGQSCCDIDQRHVVLALVVLDEPAEQRQILVAEALGDGVLELRDALRIDVVDAGELHLGDRLPRRTLDGLE